MATQAAKPPWGLVVGCDVVVLLHRRLFGPYWVHVMPIAIIPDEGVAPPPTRPVGRPKDESLQALVTQFLRLKPATATRLADSFFVPDAKRSDIEFLRKPVLKAGAGMQVVEVTKDEIYGVAGIRCWRIAGEYDEL